MTTTTNFATAKEVTSALSSLGFQPSVETIQTKLAAQTRNVVAAALARSGRHDVFGFTGGQDFRSDRIGQWLLP